VGVKYLVYANKSPRGLFVSWCSRTGGFTIIGFAGRRYHVEATTWSADGDRALKSGPVAVVMGSASLTVTISIRRP
jgi:hypothetical protein